MEVDVLIIGTGISALYLALNLNENLKILMVSKGDLTETNSYLAQGGISTARNTDDIPLFIEDTLKAGQYLNNKNSVKVLAAESMDNIKNLINLGVPFDSKDGKILFTKEGAHSINRIVHVKDETGKGVSEVLLYEVMKRKNITLMKNTMLVDLIKKASRCVGGVFIRNTSHSQNQLNVFSRVTILATGGIGGLFNDSTNQRCLTGDGLYLSLKNGIALKDLEYIQTHPTALYSKNNIGKRFLISEALRGEGAILLNSKGERFVDELLPRDVVSNAIMDEITSSGIPYVNLDISFKNSYYLKDRFPAIYARCLEEGIDLTKEPIPVSPVQHYFMGGINVDINSKTSMKNLYAVGETSCTGVHGANRLASNSLLEALVFSRRAALDINKNISSIAMMIFNVPKVDKTLDDLQTEMKKVTIEEFKRRLKVVDVKLVNY